MDWKTQPKMSIIPKLMNKFNSVPIKISAGVFVTIDKIIPKFIWKINRTSVV